MAKEPEAEPPKGQNVPGVAGLINEGLGLQPGQ
jgi:hypothetical protein